MYIGFKRPCSVFQPLYVPTVFYSMAEGHSEIVQGQDRGYFE